MWVDSVSAGKQVLSRRAAWYLGSILSGADRLDRLGDEVAVKTGTSYGYRDAWAIGYDGGHVVGVWVGRPDGAAVPGLTGTEAAVPILRDAFARLAAPVPLPGPPTDVLFATSASLPPPLRAVDRVQGPSAADALEIAFPPPGARVELGLSVDANAALALKVRNGQPPFTWLANGALIAREPHARVTRWRPDSAGFATIAVIDARGASDRVQVQVE
jgi:penicillin-binding protein 1C